jgi:hypothetical protein
MVQTPLTLDPPCKDIQPFMRQRHVKEFRYLGAIREIGRLHDG